MVAATLIAVGILSLLVFVLFCALVELFHDVRQIRDALGILDRPLSIDIGAAAGTAPSNHGLPPQLDEAHSALVLFLSERCATCRILAATLGGALPAGLWIVVEAMNSEAATEFVDAHGLRPRLADGRVVMDPGGTIAGRLGLNTTPVAYRVENGVLKDAATVPSIRYLSSIIPTPSDAAISVSTRSRTFALLGFLNLRTAGVLNQFAGFDRK
jgi:hypothetical protein